jgi:hypothetical protein
MTATFNERAYQATRTAYLESLTATITDLKEMSEARRRAKTASPTSNPVATAAPAVKRKANAYSELKEQTLRAAESPVSNAPQPKPAPIARSVPSATQQPPPVTAGYTWIGGAWQRPQADPYTAAKQTALLATWNSPEVLKLSADGTDDDDEDTTPLRDRALGVMRSRKRATDPKSATFAEDYRKTLLELTKPND